MIRENIVRGLLAALLLSTSTALAAPEILKDFDSLGGNNILLDRAKALRPDAQTEIVQNRIVNRIGRNEFSPEIGMVLGGNSYLNSNSMGFNYQRHFNPRWSAGIKYNYFYNELSAEGKNLISDFEDTKPGDMAYVPEIDWPKQSYMAVVNWYPMYGKINLYNKGIVHFDVYLLGGYGQIDLKSGATNTYTAGGGMGFWFSQHLTGRVEMRYQGYEAQYFNGPREVNWTMSGITLGYML